jgi:UrcA family protein
MKSVIVNASFALLMSAAAINGAAAGTFTAMPRIAVSYADLNLKSEAGARVMLGRLQAAAASVCGGAAVSSHLDDVTAFRACTRQALDRAVSDLRSPRVSALYGMRADRVASRR